jgi:recombination protein RecA
MNTDNTKVLNRRSSVFIGGQDSCQPSKAPAGLATGFASLDRALEIGGLPRGRITEIFGPPSCGKTALALQIVAHIDRSGGAAAWIDADHSFSPAFATQLGADVSRLPVATPDSAEQAGEIARRLLASCALDLVVIDSAAALVPEVEAAASIGPSGLQSRVLGSELRKLAAAAARSGAAVLVLNQTRIHKDRVAGGVETSAGGPGLKLYAAARIAMAGAGRMVRWRIVKNSLGAAFVTGNLQWIEGIGFTEHP